MDMLAERIVVHRDCSIVSIIRYSGGDTYQARMLVLDEAFRSTSLEIDVSAASLEEASIGAIEYARQWIDWRER